LLSKPWTRWIHGAALAAIVLSGAGCRNVLGDDKSDVVVVLPGDSDSPDPDVPDDDEDGYLAEVDCNDLDASVNPGVAEVPYDGVDNDCNAATLDDDLDQDGVGRIDDCDDQDPLRYPGAIEACDGVDNDCNTLVDDAAGDLWYVDGDGDGYGVDGQTVQGCTVGLGLSALAGDCDDAVREIFPGAPERCNGLDDDCNASVDDNAADALTWHPDADGDGYGDPASVRFDCAAGTGETLDATDCNDADATIRPSGIELCNSVDDDCNGTVDDNAADAVAFYADGDDDGYGDFNQRIFACNGSLGVIDLPGDCDDTRANVSPTAAEICDGLDNDCDTFVDEAGATGGVTFYRDGDADGRGNAAGGTIEACAAPSGYAATNDDCDDLIPTIYPGAFEYCDGFDNDCDTQIDEGATSNATWYRDVDGDGFGLSNDTVSACARPVGYAPAPGDCLDTDPTVRPGGTETCNGLDDDCNGRVDDAAPGLGVPWYLDADADGYGFPLFAVTACVAPSGFVADRTDCDDLRPQTNPGAPELCDDLDNDCDRAIDEDAIDPSGWWRDVDGDGFGDTRDVSFACDRPTGYVGNFLDCDDTTSSIRPGTFETCNGLDDDCDTQIDEGASNPRGWYRDTDGDGYGDPLATLSACSPPAGYVASAGDCNDASAAINPGALERCGGGDEDCDGRTDESDAADATTFYVDADTDGFGNVNRPQSACRAPAGTVANASDCDDSRGAINPNADEVCNGLDDDCDGGVDLGATGSGQWFADADGDGFGDPAAAVGACSAPAGYVSDSSDCDDTTTLVSPARSETCDGLDNDCTGVADDNALDAGTYYRDRDADGYGDRLASLSACVAPAGYVANRNDCADNDDLRNPAADEVCDGVDNDCDGSVDQGAINVGVYYRDVDGDFVGDAGDSYVGCALAGYVTVAGDCDDTLATVAPGRPEACNGRDDDCDTQIDENATTGTVSVFRDGDGDGYGSGGSVAVCAGTAGYAAAGGDCDDRATNIYPGAPEFCDTFDNDCDGQVDENTIANATWYADNDLDGFGDATDSVETCTPPAGYVSSSTDCDDANAAAYPGAAELCDAFDNDCDGQTDESATNAPIWYADIDADGYGRASLTQRACTAPSGFVSDATDCDDNRQQSNPGAPEICDGLDNDCDLLVDDGVVNATAWYADVDGDGYGSGTALFACGAPSGYVSNASDCDDGSAQVRPGGIEICDGRDDDCDGQIDESAINPRTWYRDVDGDSWGDVNATASACAAPTGYAGRAGDCDDGRASDRPGGTEVCDGRDNDCDAATDEGAADAATWYVDADADGYGNPLGERVACAAPAGTVANAQDCADNLAAVNPAASETCNGRDDDCDGAVDDAAVGSVVWYADADDDGFGNAASSQSACFQPSGFVRSATDCNDARNTVYPGANEVCDGFDNDCDLAVDEGAAGAGTYYADADVDGFGDPNVSRVACSAPAGFVANASDCNDDAVEANPNGTEVCDDIDNNCDGTVDNNATNAATYYRDGDGDGFVDLQTTLASCKATPGYTTTVTADDCADNLATVYPGGTETCDGQDNDCNGAVDDGAVSVATWYRDLDGDGFGAPGVSINTCSPPAGYVLDRRDCNDAASTVFPGAAEVCDGVDQDCDGAIDDSAVDALTWYADADADGYGAGATTRACTLPVGYAGRAGDCNDAASGVYPTAVETCDSVDQDCDGVVDDNASGAATWYRDADVDGFGNPDFGLRACTQPIGFVAEGSDCADAVATIAPGKPELCDGLDNDCDTLVDEGVTNQTRFYVDGDADQYGGPSNSVLACVNPGGYLTVGGDCNDAVSSINPGAPEYCDSIDNNCNGLVDDGAAVDALTWYADADADLYGNSAVSLPACTKPSGYVANSTDCNDLRSADNPGASEVCDGFDNDCDRATDEADAVNAPTWYVDNDGDAYGTTVSTRRQCAAPAGFASASGDCDDTRNAVNPGAPEVCDGRDNDCNGTIDGPSSVDAVRYYRDADGDGFGAPAVSTTACTQPSGYVADGRDCNDTTTAIKPGATETCNGKDDNCSSTIDETPNLCPSVVFMYNGHGYMWVVTGRSWTQARDFCTSYGYYLITVNDAAENVWADDFSVTFSTTRWWTGLNDLALEDAGRAGDQWVWVNGETSTYRNWAVGEPNNVYSTTLRQDEDCMQFNRYGDGTWNDEWCSQALPFICETSGP
jgi:hypothetical protein